MKLGRSFARSSLWKHDYFAPARLEVEQAFALHVRFATSFTSFSSFSPQLADIILVNVAGFKRVRSLLTQLGPLEVLTR